jgi:hypothetical protein
MYWLNTRYDGHPTLSTIQLKSDASAADKLAAARQQIVDLTLKRVPPGTRDPSSRTWWRGRPRGVGDDAAEVTTEPLEQQTQLDELVAELAELVAVERESSGHGAASLHCGALP